MKSERTSGGRRDVEGVERAPWREWDDTSPASTHILDSVKHDLEQLASDRPTVHPFIEAQTACQHAEASSFVVQFDASA